jgi:preprotein translocase subunit SecD
MGGLMFVRPYFSLVLAATFVFSAVPAMADDIAFSLVNGQNRIDIPVSAIRRIEALATQTFVVTETKQKREFPLPHVNLCYAAGIQKKICQFTRRIVEQPMDIVVDCEAISKPVVREPLCGSCLQISANTFMDANALAQRLKTGSNRRCAPVS